MGTRDVFAEHNKGIENKPFEYNSRNGTWFTADRCDFRGGVVVRTRPGLPLDKLAQDISDMVGYHATNINEHLPSFQGYNAIEYRFVHP